MSRRSSRFERRAPERIIAREQRRDQDFERGFGGALHHRSVREERELATPRDHYDPVNGKGAILGKAQITQPWPYTPEQVQDICRGLILQLNPFNVEIEPPIDGLSIITMDLPALHDYRGLGLSHGSVVIRNDRVAVQPFEEADYLWI